MCLKANLKISKTSQTKLRSFNPKNVKAVLYSSQITYFVVENEILLINSRISMQRGRTFSLGLLRNQSLADELSRNKKSVSQPFQILPNMLPQPRNSAAIHLSHFCKSCFQVDPGTHAIAQLPSIFFNQVSCLSLREIRGSRAL